MTKINENEPGVVWCKPWGEGQGDYVRVGLADFDADVHELYDPADIDGDGNLSAKELKAALTELGVEFKGNAKKADLQALYDANKKDA